MAVIQMADRLLTAEELIAELAAYDHVELHMHHTWKPNHSSFTGDNHQAIQDGMRNYHMDERGWTDIGQHASLFPDGLFMTGRDFGRNPASIYGKNTRAFAVEMVADFDEGQDVFEGVQKESMLKLAKFFNNQGKYIRFHRENADKTCPGSSIDKETFMSEVKAYGQEETVSDWALDAQEWVIEQGISDGTRPKETLTREEAWVMLHRADKET